MDAPRLLAAAALLASSAQGQAGAMPWPPSPSDASRWARAVPSVREMLSSG